MQPPADARPTPRRPDQTRESLLAAGTELFAELGFDGATVEEIARRAGVNKALINYHFRGKEGLYHAILLDHFEGTNRQVLAIEAEPGSAAERLRRILRLMRERVERRPTLPSVLLRETISGGNHLDDSVLRFMGGMADTVQRIIADGVRSGEFRRIDPHRVYLSLFGGLFFFFGTRGFRERLHESGHFATPPPTPEEFMDHTLDFMLRALVPGADDRREDSP